MRETPRSDHHRAGSLATHRSHASRAIVLWRLRGATDELIGLAFQTSFGCALGLELDTELLLFHLQPNMECLLAYSKRIESALIAQGWSAIADHITGRSRHESF
jgi:hypothetical protein